MADTRAYEILGVPTSAGAPHAGLEHGPSALRGADLVRRLRDGGLDVAEGIDLPGADFRVDSDPVGGARSIASVLEVAGTVADEVERIVGAGRIPLVLGGDATITLGVVAGVQRTGVETGAAYVTGDAELSIPGRWGSGILSSTGVAHLLGLIDSPLGRLGPSWPPLEDDQLVLLGYDPSDDDQFDDGLLGHRSDLLHFSDAHLRDLPMDGVGIARTRLDPLEALVVHFDVDAVDSADLPLSDTPHYAQGIGWEGAQEVLQFLLSAPNLAALVLPEVNPTHDATGELLERFVSGVTAALINA